MNSGYQLGTKVRSMRRRQSISQVQLARTLGISASYLNLIEHNHRPLTASLLVEIAKHFEVDLAEFGADTTAQLNSDLLETLSDPLFEGLALMAPEVREVVNNQPEIATAITTLYQAYQGAKRSAHDLAIKLTGDDAASTTSSATEEVTSFLQRHLNYFPNLDNDAEKMWGRADLIGKGVYKGLQHLLREEAGVTVSIVSANENGILRRYNPQTRHLQLAEELPPRSRNFQLATQLALLTQRPTLNTLVKDPCFTSDESRSLGRVVLSHYFAAALLMPYTIFLVAAKEVRYDIALLGHRFHTSFEQVCHRLTNLRRPGNEGIPFHMIRTDLAGNISKRFSASGMRFPRFSGACPKWNVFNAFLTPTMIRRQASILPDGSRFFGISRTVNRQLGGYQQFNTLFAVGIGCRIEHATQMVYADGLDLSQNHSEIGTSCRLCPRPKCDQRAFPPTQQPQIVDENERGFSIYTSAR